MKQFAGPDERIGWITLWGNRKKLPTQVYLAYYADVLLLVLIITVIPRLRIQTWSETCVTTGWVSQRLVSVCTVLSGSWIHLKHCADVVTHTVLTCVCFKVRYFHRGLRNAVSVCWFGFVLTIISWFSMLLVRLYIVVLIDLYSVTCASLWNKECSTNCCRHESSSG